MADESSQAQDAGTTTAAQDEAGKTFDAAYVATLRQEAAKYRTQLRDAQDQLKATAPKAEQFDKLTEAQKTDQQKLADKLTAMEAQLATATAQATAAQQQANLMRLANKAGVDPDVAAMLDITKIPLDDEAKALEALKRFATATNGAQVKPGAIGGMTEADMRAAYLGGGKSKAMIFGG